MYKFCLVELLGITPLINIRSSIMDELIDTTYLDVFFFFKSIEVFSRYCMIGTALMALPTLII